jgi:hypothetical protein
VIKNSNNEAVSPLSRAEAAVSDMTKQFQSIMMVLANPLDLNEKQRLILIERVSGMQATAVSAIMIALVDHEVRLELLEDGLSTLGDAVFPAPEASDPGVDPKDEPIA